jgi:hypothetical protein
MIESAEEFVRLRCSQQRDEYRRAAHEPAPIGVWEEVIARFPEMRVWVVQNKTVPAEVLELLIHDRDPRVRSAIAEKRKLTRKLFDRLLDDSDASVRARLACNAKAPQDVLVRLASDPDPIVSSAARERLGAR